MTAAALASVTPQEAPIRLGVSACLLGECVRHDGGHKKDTYLVEQLGRFVEWVPVCPEVEIGLGVPRETIQLESRSRGIRLLGTDSRVDHAPAMRRWAKRQLSELAKRSLAGYVFKSHSPSCGVDGVALTGEDGVARQVGQGVFTTALMDRFPHLPVAEEGCLDDPERRESFLERVFAYDRLRSLFAGKWKPRDAVEFHARHKLQLKAHSPNLHAALNRLVARVAGLARGEFRSVYESLFMEALGTRPTRSKHADVLRHAMGHLRPQLDEGARKELRVRIDEFHQGSTALATPLTLIRDHMRRVDVPYLQGQFYLQPDPREWMLRYSVPPVGPRRGKIT